MVSAAILGTLVGLISSSIYYFVTRVWFLNDPNTSFPQRRRASVVTAATDVGADCGVVVSSLLAPTKTIATVGPMLVALTNLIWVLVTDVICAKASDTGVEQARRQSPTLPKCHKTLYGIVTINNFFTSWELFLIVWFTMAVAIDIYLALVSALEDDVAMWGAYAVLGCVGIGSMVSSYGVGISWSGLDSEDRSRGFSTMLVGLRCFSTVVDFILAVAASSNLFLALGIIGGITDTIQWILGRTDLSFDCIDTEPNDDTDIEAAPEMPSTGDDASGVEMAPTGGDANDTRANKCGGINTASTRHDDLVFESPAGDDATERNENLVADAGLG